jgi:hypothetical protein
MAREPASEPEPPPASKGETEKPGSRLVVVELARRRSPRQVKRLRSGRGKLVADIEDVIDELVKSGTIERGSAPVVIVVREVSAHPIWGVYDGDDHCDDDDEDDDDDDYE